MWRCPNCGESVEQHFDVCWNCSSDKIGAVDPGFIAEPQDRSVPDPGAAVATSGYSSKVVTNSGRKDNSLAKALAASWRWFGRRSHWFIALTTLGFLWIALVLLFGFGLSNSANELVFVVSGVSLFIPGAIRRGNVKHVLAMSALGIIAPFLTDWAISPFIRSNSYLLWYVLWPAWMITLVGVGEWLAAPGGSLRVLAWVTLACLSATACFAVLHFTVYHIPALGIVADIVSLTVITLATWIAVPAGFRLANVKRRGIKNVALGVALTLAGFCAAMFTSGFYSLAKTSLLGSGPFSKNYGVQLLAHRGRESDFEFIFDRLRRADWSEPFTFPPGTSMTADDWRETAVRLLIRYDADWAGTRLAGLLIEQPSRQLIDMTDGLFVEKKRYETAPLYMRYALLDSIQPSYFALVGDDRYKLALQELEVPQVVRAWLTEAFYSSILSEVLRARAEGRNPDLEDVELLVFDEFREKMAERLGADAGPYMSDWETLYEARISTVPTPLSKAQQDEIERVIRCIEQYDSALGNWHDVVEQSKLQARVTATKPAAPDWDVPTIEALEVEVLRFVREVNLAAGYGV
jgi:hypothetical protein